MKIIDVLDAQTFSSLSSLYHFVSFPLPPLSLYLSLSLSQRNVIRSTVLLVEELAVEQEEQQIDIDAGSGGEHLKNGAPFVLQLEQFAELPHNWLDIGDLRCHSKHKHSLLIRRDGQSNSRKHSSRNAYKREKMRVRK